MSARMIFRPWCWFFGHYVKFSTYPLCLRCGGKKRGGRL